MENLRNIILIELWESKEVNSVISKMQPTDLQDDLKSESFLILAELDEAKLIGLWERKEIKFYLVRIILNLIKSTDKKFYLKYRNFIEYKEINTMENEQEDITDEVSKYLEELYWYKKELLKLYVEKFNFNAKALSRETTIPYMSIIRTLNQTKAEIKKKIK